MRHSFKPLLWSSIFFISSPVFAGLRCESVFIESKIDNWQDALRLLTGSTDPRLKQPFRVRANAEDGNPVDGPNLAAKYQNARFLVAESPATVPTGARVLRGLSFGYALGEFRVLGPLNYLVVDRGGQVLEVGGGSPEVLREFGFHLRGRTLTAQEHRTINEINAKLLADLRASPQGREEIAKFAKKRGWPAGLEGDNHLAYFSERILPLKEWAAKNGYTNEQMRDAGWMLMSFDVQGRPRFFTNADDSIKIPFFGEAGQTTIPVWRSRMLHPRPSDPKYRGWQMDRSLEREYTVAETLYNGWKLNQAQGKTIVITEGEFKCMVAEKATGILTVGIPGISQFDAAIGQALIAARPKEIIVVLDRDPKGKGLMRVDGITDSQRAAYSIASQLRELGATNVKVGVLPDVFDGGKVGIDDLLLGPGTETYLQTLATALSPDAYARHIGLDVQLHELHRQRQALRKAFENQQRAALRGDGDLSTSERTQVQSMISKLDGQFIEMIGARYAGARQFTRPSVLFPYIPARPEHQRAQPTPFDSDILIMDYVPRDLRAKAQCRPGPCSELGLDAETIQKILTGKEISRELEKGRELAAASQFEPRTPEEQAQVLMAGYLSHDFPPDDYTIRFSIQLPSKENTPLLIMKKGEGKVVAVARLRIDDVDSQQSGSLFSRIWRALRTAP